MTKETCFRRETSNTGKERKKRGGVHPRKLRVGDQGHRGFSNDLTTTRAILEGEVRKKVERGGGMRSEL